MLCLHFTHEKRCLLLRAASKLATLERSFKLPGPSSQICDMCHFLTSILFSIIHNLLLVHNNNYRSSSRSCVFGRFGYFIHPFFFFACLVCRHLSTCCGMSVLVCARLAFALCFGFSCFGCHFAFIYLTGATLRIRDLGWQQQQLAGGGGYTCPSSYA